MKHTAKYPLETLVVFSLIYYSGIVLFLEPIRFKYKLFYMLIALISAFALFLVSFAFKKEMNIFKFKLFDVFISGRFQKSNLLRKLYYLISLSFVPLTIATLLEFLLIVVFTDAGAITIGFPLPFYSFSANLIIFRNLLVDIVLFASAIYFIGYTLIHTPDSEM